ncbi:MAG: PucR family transcriptional regulator, partial [Acidipropionibacterium acidipropionici]|nr:PucR family transcriptional regulator [Acidipropionibacterium acidipropionici]
MAKRLAARTSAMTTDTLAQMAERHSWFRELSADDRSWISIVARNGIDGFVRWFADDEAEPYSPTDVFDVAPRSMTRKISLHQTVDLVRTTIEVVEEQITEKMPRGDRSVLSNAIVHYSREVAFAAAEVYARAAEQRGTWDERLESLVVDAIVRDDVDDEQLASRASTLGWKPG